MDSTGNNNNIKCIWNIDGLVDWNIDGLVDFTSDNKEFSLDRYDVNSMMNSFLNLIRITICIWDWCSNIVFVTSIRYNNNWLRI